MSTRAQSSRDHSTERDHDDLAALILTRSRSLDVTITEGGAIPQPPLTTKIGSEVPVTTCQIPSSAWFPTKNRILLCAFLTSMTFGVTQVPLLYVFRFMTCDAYYESHPSPSAGHDISGWLSTALRLMDAQMIMIAPHLSKSSDNKGDRCAIHSIEASTALSVAILAASTTIFGIFNLFLTGSLIKQIGVQRTLIIQIFVPAIRLLIQNIGIEVWGSTGILIVQCSQVSNVIGGPSGYVLALNQFITEAVDYAERTAALGRLAGTMLFGSAFGFLIGGILAEVFGIKSPFRVTLALFLCATAFVVLFLPYVPPASTREDSAIPAHETQTDNAEPGKPAKSRFLGPLLVFRPRSFILENGKVQTEYGALLLACGVFLGILSTGYLPTLLQMYSTNVFNFGTQENGWLIFMYCFLRGVVLTFAFPRFIAMGRRYVARKEEALRSASSTSGSTDTTTEYEPLLHEQRQTTNTNARSEASKEAQVYTFDLTYTKLSTVADGILTLSCAFIQEGWQMYLVAAILPFAAGTGSAAKGSVLQIVGANASGDERTDALAGIGLVENVARLATTTVFGIVFASFTTLGRPELVFVVNAACALGAFVVLLIAHFPPRGARRLDKEDKIITVDESE